MNVHMLNLYQINCTKLYILLEKFYMNVLMYTIYIHFIYKVIEILLGGFRATATGIKDGLTDGSVKNTNISATLWVVYNKHFYRYYQRECLQILVSEQTTTNLGSSNPSPNVIFLQYWFCWHCLIHYILEHGVKISDKCRITWPRIDMPRLQVFIRASSTAYSIFTKNRRKNLTDT